MQSQTGVDVESKIKHGGPIVDHHGSPVCAEDFDLGLIDITRLYLVHGPPEECVFADPVAGPVALIVIFGSDEEAVEVVPIIREQEIC